jgi:diguanylate cyclase (GGDEF)-like protein
MNWITPFHPAQEDRQYMRALQKALVQDLYLRSKAPVIILLASMGLLYAILRDLLASHKPLQVLFPCLVMVTLGRALLVVQGDGLQGRARRTVPRFTLFFAGTFGSGLFLGAVFLAAFPFLDPGRLLLLCLCLMGINSMAVVSMGASPACFASLMLPSLGSIAVAGALHPPFGLGALFSLTILAGIAGFVFVSLEVHAFICRNVLLSERLGDLALRDPLTGLRNRRYLYEFMQEETPRVLRRWLGQDVEARSRRSISLILVDLDFFKQVNDTYGHAAGDAVLLQVAQLLKEVVRKPDLVIRWGGEEFLLLALDSDRVAPPLIAVRVHERMAQQVFLLPGGQTLRMTCSVGYAIYPFHPERPEGLLWEQVFHMADTSLYRAKESGRNCLNGILPGSGDADAIVAAMAQPDPDIQAAARAELIRLL